MRETSKMLVWNRGDRVRKFAAAGKPRALHRGLNLVDVVHWHAMRSDAQRVAELEELGTSLKQMDVDKLVEAIVETRRHLQEPASFCGQGPRPGVVALLWLAEQETPPAVSRVLTVTS